MSTHTFEDFKRRFDALSDYIEKTQAAVSKGVLGDLTTLDNQVLALCKDVESTGGQAAKDAQPLIADMIRQLDDLAAALQAYKAQQEQDGS